MKILGKIPSKVYLACSGGIDSMVVLDFLLKGKRDVIVLYYNHNTKHGYEAEKFIHDFCREKNLELHIGQYRNTIQTEEAWREARYEFLTWRKTDIPIITCHHLNDNIETYLMSSIKGTPKFIPYQRNKIIRPFLLTSKIEIIAYAKKHNIVWCEDPSNIENNYSRNKIRNQVIPILQEINPGLEKTFKQKCVDKYKKDGII